jgi:hypothetical protein
MPILVLSNTTPNSVTDRAEFPEDAQDDAECHAHDICWQSVKAGNGYAQALVLYPDGRSVMVEVSCPDHA